MIRARLMTVFGQAEQGAPRRPVGESLCRFAIERHLRVPRMRRAMRLLAETDRTLASRASEVGCQDAFISKVFERTVGVAEGLPPARCSRRTAPVAPRSGLAGSRCSGRGCRPLRSYQEAPAASKQVAAGAR